MLGVAATREGGSKRDMLCMTGWPPFAPSTNAWGHIMYGPGRVEDQLLSLGSDQIGGGWSLKRASGSLIRPEVMHMAPMAMPKLLSPMTPGSEGSGLLPHNPGSPRLLNSMALANGHTTSMLAVHWHVSEAAPPGSPYGLWSYREPVSTSSQASRR